jgi:hypothetical protein
MYTLVHLAASLQHPVDAAMLQLNSCATCSLVNTTVSGMLLILLQSAQQQAQHNAQCTMCTKACVAAWLQVLPGGLGEQGGGLPAAEQHGEEQQLPSGADMAASGQAELDMFQLRHQQLAEDLAEHRRAIQERDQRVAERTATAEAAQAALNDATQQLQAAVQERDQAKAAAAAAAAEAQQLVRAAEVEEELRRLCCLAAQKQLERRKVDQAEQLKQVSP